MLELNSRNSNFKQDLTRIKISCKNQVHKYNKSRLLIVETVNFQEFHRSQRKQILTKSCKFVLQSPVKNELQFSQNWYEIYFNL